MKTDTATIRWWIKQFLAGNPDIEPANEFSTCTAAELAAQCGRRFVRKAGLAVKVAQEGRWVRLTRIAGQGQPPQTAEERIVHFAAPRLSATWGAGSITLPASDTRNGRVTCVRSMLRRGRTMPEATTDPRRSVPVPAGSPSRELKHPCRSAGGGWTGWGAGWLLRLGKFGFCVIQPLADPFGYEVLIGDALLLPSVQSSPNGHQPLVLRVGDGDRQAHAFRSCWVFSHYKSHSTPPNALASVRLRASGV